MTTVTWSASAPVTPIQNITVPGTRIIAKIGRTCGVILRSMTSADSDFLGLDLNGNPMWIKR